MKQLPETVLQFGSGKFLRAFADLFIHQVNQQGHDVGRVVVVQTTGEERARLLNQQGGRYHVLIRGLADGATVDRTEEVASISRALVVSRQWPEVLTVARSPDLRYVISNTAEVGYTLYARDRPTDVPPRSFPAKLLLLLKERHDAGHPGLTILPCELFEHNADRLLGIVVDLAQSWQFPAVLTDWIRTACRWRNTLVDRIVAVAPPDHPLLKEDALLTVAEPFALWAVEAKHGPGGLFRHSAIQETPDVQAFFLRKVRILNAAHTALLSRAMPRGLRTVREAVLDPEISDWLNRLFFDEIIPTVRGRVEAPEEFAGQTLERFRNPFLEHKLSDIAAYHEAKVQVRLVPTRAEFVAKFGRAPPLLDEAIAWAGPAKTS